MASEFLRIIYIVAKDFPDDEKFGLTSQIRRATLSILLNIAEGSDRGSDKEFIRFLRISYTSLLEVISCCYVAMDQGYMTKARFDYIYEKSQTLSKKINSLIKYLNR
ncbi:four helix bundle protein [Patescibacteria group bacterium]|nr:four helix bundle protein [Patescibacteria group bacterium]